MKAQATFIRLYRTHKLKHAGVANLTATRLHTHRGPYQSLVWQSYRDTETEEPRPRPGAQSTFFSKRRCIDYSLQQTVTDAHKCKLMQIAQQLVPTASRKCSDLISITFCSLDSRRLKETFCSLSAFTSLSENHFSAHRVPELPKKHAGWGLPDQLW